MMYQSKTTNLCYVYYVLGQHVSILIESSSGPSKKTDPYLEMCGIPIKNVSVWDPTAHFKHF
jgi:hypothetical protein